MENNLLWMGNRVIVNGNLIIENYNNKGDVGLVLENEDDDDPFEDPPGSSPIVFDLNVDGIKSGTSWLDVDDGLLVWDTPIQMRPVRLKVVRPRYRCRACKATSLP